MKQYYINVPFTLNWKIFTYTGLNMKKKWLLQMDEVTFNCGILSALLSSLQKKKFSKKLSVIKRTILNCT